MNHGIAMNQAGGDQFEEPGRRHPAPGDLRTVQLLVNSLDVEKGADSFDRPEVVSRWLRDRNLTTEPETVRSEFEPRRVIDLRESLRDLLIDNHEEKSPPDTGRDILAAVASAGALSVDVDHHGDVKVVATPRISTERSPGSC